MSTELLLVRHGQTAWHQNNRYTGRSDIPLDQVGKEQALALGNWSRNAGLTHIACSPLRRCLDTAAPVAQATGLTVDKVPALREIDFGDAEGHTINEMRTADPAATSAFEADPIAAHWPGGDDPRTRTPDAVAALREIAMTRRQGRILVVTHSTLIRLCLCLLLGIELAAYRKALARPDPAHACVLSVSERHTVLVRYNTPLSEDLSPRVTPTYGLPWPD